MLIKSAKEVRTGDTLEGPLGYRCKVLSRGRIHGIGPVFNTEDGGYLPAHAARKGWKIVKRSTNSKPK